MKGICGKCNVECEVINREIYTEKCPKCLEEYVFDMGDIGL